MATLVHELDLPTITETVTTREASRQRIADLGAAHWLIRVPLGYVVHRHSDVVSLLRDQRFHSALQLAAQMRGVTDEEFLSRPRRPSILSMEGDEHQRIRRLVGPAFTPKAADRLRPFMADLVNELVDAVAPLGRTEAVADICEPYPVPVICELLGAPRDDWKQFGRWATDIFRIFDQELASYTKVVMAAQDELDTYVRALIERRRDEPGDDLLTALIAAEEAGDRLSPDELVSMVEAVLLAGTDTTRNQLACALALFAAHPEQWRQLADDPSLAPHAVEECMRYLGSVDGTARFAAGDVEYRDVVFPAGTLVFPSLLGANFDGTVWDDSNRFDITRERPVPQMTFGSGIHFCLGSFLARAELQEALVVLSRRLANMAVDGQITWKPTTVGIWGPARVPLTFDAA